MTWDELPRNPPPATLRRFAALCLLVFGALAAARDSVPFALLAVGVGVPGLVHPPLVRWVFVGWLTAVFPVGWAVSWAALAAVYFGVLTPVALAFRLWGRDGLRLRGGADSYWQPRPAPAAAAGYYRQY